MVRFRRVVALGALALATTACSGGTAAVHTPTGQVCGVQAMSGGPAPGVQDPALVHICGPRPFRPAYWFSIVASNGKRYKAYVDKLGGWSERLPAGTYRVDGKGGCGLEHPFVVTAGKILKGVIAWFGCLIP